MSKYLIPGVIVALVLGGVFYVYKPAETTAPVLPAPAPSPVTTSTSTTTTTTVTSTNTTAPSVKTIQMFDDKYVPMDITIKQGDTITFVNYGQNRHWPASALHPTHQVYPEFDAKRGIAPGDSWSFKFDKVGVWRWHDHLYPTIYGKITVQAK